MISLTSRIYIVCELKLQFFETPLIFFEIFKWCCTSSNYLSLETIEISRDFVVWTHHHLKWSEKTTQIVRLNKTKFNYYVITMIEHKLYYHARKLGTKILLMVNGYHLVKIWHCLKLAHILSKTREVLNYLGICNYKSLSCRTIVLGIIQKCKCQT